VGHRRPALVLAAALLVGACTDGDDDRTAAPAETGEPPVGLTVAPTTSPVVLVADAVFDAADTRPCGPDELVGTASLDRPTYALGEEVVVALAS
jgi:hypothetical protein